MMIARVDKTYTNLREVFSTSLGKAMKAANWQIAPTAIKYGYKSSWQIAYLK